MAGAGNNMTVTLQKLLQKYSVSALAFKDSDDWITHYVARFLRCVYS